LLHAEIDHAGQLFKPIVIEQHPSGMVMNGCAAPKPALRFAGSTGNRSTSGLIKGVYWLFCVAASFSGA